MGNLCGLHVFRIRYTCTPWRVLARHGCAITICMRVCVWEREKRASALCNLKAAAANHASCWMNALETCSICSRVPSCGAKNQRCICARYKVLYRATTARFAAVTSRLKVTCCVCGFIHLAGNFQRHVPAAWLNLNSVLLIALWLNLCDALHKPILRA